MWWMLMLWPVLVGLIWGLWAMLAALALATVIGWSLLLYVQRRYRL